MRMLGQADIAHALRRLEFFSVTIRAPCNRVACRLLRFCGAALCAQLFLAVPVAHADCGREQVVVFGTFEERSAACRALAEVRSYFMQGGFNIELVLTVRFQDRVELTAKDEFTHAPEQWPVSGYYRATTKELFMTRLNAPWTSERTPWHLVWDEEVGFSILEHEIIHAAIAQIMGERYRKLQHAWHEALAYAIEIDLMQPDLRAKVLANFPNVKPFSSTLEINELVYAFDPDSFAVAAYKTYVKNRGIEFVKKAINLKLDMSDLPPDFQPP